MFIKQLEYDCILQYCNMLYLFPVCPAEGSRSHQIIKSHMSHVCVLLCVCVFECMWAENIQLCAVCVCVHTGVQKCIHVCSICMWAYVHLHVCGVSLRWLLTCAEVIVVAFYLPHYRKFSCSSRQRGKWLMLMSAPLQSDVGLVAPSPRP